MGARVRAARNAIPLTQEQLGGKVGIGKGMISALERAEYAPSVEVLIALGVTLRTGVDALIYGRGFQPQAPIPGLSLDARIESLPEAMRQAVIETLKKCELAAAALPAGFLVAPTGENVDKFMALLDQLSREKPSP